jgi:hypothetical protein
MKLLGCSGESGLFKKAYNLWFRGGEINGLEGNPGLGGDAERAIVGC